MDKIVTPLQLEKKIILLYGVHSAKVTVTDNYPVAIIDVQFGFVVQLMCMLFSNYRKARISQIMELCNQTFPDGFSWYLKLVV